MKKLFLILMLFLTTNLTNMFAMKIPTVEQQSGEKRFVYIEETEAENYKMLVMSLKQFITRISECLKIKIAHNEEIEKVNLEIPKHIFEAFSTSNKKEFSPKILWNTRLFLAKEFLATKNYLLSENKEIYYLKQKNL